MLFGLFHIHRIWALFDREGYAAFWLGILERRGAAYFAISGVLAGLCVLGILTFIRERGANPPWRWVYVFGGSYLLFDLFAIAAGLGFWSRLLAAMFDTRSPYWNAVWGFFILLGAAVFLLGIRLLTKYKRQG